MPVLDKRIHDTVPALYIVPEHAGDAAAEDVRRALVSAYLAGDALDTGVLPSQFFLVDDIPCNANGKIDIYRITRDRLRGEAWNIVPVREAGRLTDILAEPAGQADSITGGSLPEGMEGRSALGIYELFNTAPEQRQKGSPASSVGLWRSKYAEHMAMLIKMLFQNKGRE